MSCRSQRLPEPGGVASGIAPAEIEACWITRLIRTPYARPQALERARNQLVVLEHPPTGVRMHRLGWHLSLVEHDRDIWADAEQQPGGLADGARSLDIERDTERLQAPRRDLLSLVPQQRFGRATRDSL